MSRHSDLMFRLQGYVATAKSRPARTNEDDPFACDPERMKAFFDHLDWQREVADRCGQIETTIPSAFEVTIDIETPKQFRLYRELCDLCDREIAKAIFANPNNADPGNLPSAEVAQTVREEVLLDTTQRLCQNEGTRDEDDS